MRVEVFRWGASVSSVYAFAFQRPCCNYGILTSGIQLLSRIKLAHKSTFRLSAMCIQSAFTTATLLPRASIVASYVQLSSKRSHDIFEEMGCFLKGLEHTQSPRLEPRAARAMPGSYEGQTSRELPVGHSRPKIGGLSGSMARAMTLSALQYYRRSV